MKEDRRKGAEHVRPQPSLSCTGWPGPPRIGVTGAESYWLKRIWTSSGSASPPFDETLLWVHAVDLDVF